ncbi:MAG TPA: hypothetical protein VEN95_10235 [Actinomycetota bacterium]|nr:hypothetical protein [Actinomycetota bacterium]
MSANVGVPLGLFVGFGLCVAVVSLTIAPKRTPESRARPESGREVDRRRRAAGAAIGAGLAGIGGGQALSTIPSHPVWIWMLAGLLFWGVPLVAVTFVARWAAKNLTDPGPTCSGRGTDVDFPIRSARAERRSSSGPSSLGSWSLA